MMQLRIIPPSLFPLRFPKGARHTSSHSDAILVTLYHAKSTSSPSSPPVYSMSNAAGTGPESKTATPPAYVSLIN
eukprot:scaffold172860_cov19-Tisochrysis_lutea.AAC.2